MDMEWVGGVSVGILAATCSRTAWAGYFVMDPFVLAFFGWVLAAGGD